MGRMSRRRHPAQRRPHAGFRRGGGRRRGARGSAAPHASRGGAHVLRLASVDHPARSEEHTSELQSQSNLVCRLLLEKKNNTCALASSTPAIASTNKRPIKSPH